MKLLFVQLGKHYLLVIRLDFIFDDPARRVYRLIHKCRHKNTSRTLFCAVSIIGRLREGL